MASETSVDRQRESSAGNGRAGVAEVEEYVETVGPRCGSRRTPEGMRVVERISSK